MPGDDEPRSPSTTPAEHPTLPEADRPSAASGQTAAITPELIPPPVAAAYGLSTADVLAQAEGLFRSPWQQVMTAHLVHKAEAAQARAEKERDDAYAERDRLRQDREDLRIENTRLNSASRLQTSQALLFMLGGAVLGAGVAPVIDLKPAGFVLVAVGLLLGFIAWGMRSAGPEKQR